MSVAYKIIGGDGREYGPATLEEIRGWCEDGRVGAGTPVWRDDEKCWQPARTREELRWDLRQTAPPPLPAPQAPAEPPSAGFAIRLAAWIFDWVLLDLLINLLASPWGAKWEQINKIALAQLTENASSPESTNAVLTVFGVAVAVGFLYSVCFNVLQGATPGKRVLGLRVVCIDGSPLTWRIASLRRAAELISQLAFGMGYLFILVNRENRAVHDLLARTKVVWVRRG